MSLSVRVSMPNCLCLYLSVLVCLIAYVSICYRVYRTHYVVCLCVFVLYFTVCFLLQYIWSVYCPHACLFVAFLILCQISSPSILFSLSMSECWLFVCLSICLLCLILLLCLNVGCLSACLSVISVWYSFYVWMLADCLLVYLSSLSDTPSCLNVGWLSACLSVISVCCTVCLSLFLSFLSFTLCSL